MHLERWSSCRPTSTITQYTLDKRFTNIKWSSMANALCTGLYNCTCDCFGVRVESPSCVVSSHSPVKSPSSEVTLLCLYTCSASAAHKSRLLSLKHLKTNEWNKHLCCLTVNSVQATSSRSQVLHRWASDELQMSFTQLHSSLKWAQCNLCYIELYGRAS